MDMKQKPDKKKNKTHTHSIRVLQSIHRDRERAAREQHKML